jgi:hypothetical protein
MVTTGQPTPTRARRLPTPASHSLGVLYDCGKVSIMEALVLHVYTDQVTIPQHARQCQSTVPTTQMTKQGSMLIHISQSKSLLTIHEQSPSGHLLDPRLAFWPSAHSRRVAAKESASRVCAGGREEA